MYTVTFKGKKHSVSGTVFWSLALPVLAVFALVVCWAGWLIYLSTNMLEDYTGISAFVCGLVALVLLGSMTINGQEKALLPSPVRYGLGLCLVWVTVYYQYAVQHWAMSKLALLATPLVVLGLRKLLDKKAA